MTKVKFGQVPNGLQFHILGDKRTWFKTNEQAFTFKSDGNTKVWIDFIPFGQVVEVEVQEEQPHRDKY